jgi:hypothetical protein
MKVKKEISLETHDAHKIKGMWPLVDVDSMLNVPNG